MVPRSAAETVMLFAFHAKIFTLILCSSSFVKDESVVAIRGWTPLDVHLAIKCLLKWVLVILIHLVRAQTLLHVTFTNLPSALSIWTDQGAFSLIDVRLQKVIEAFLMKHVSTTCQWYYLSPLIWLITYGTFIVLHLYFFNFGFFFDLLHLITFIILACMKCLTINFFIGKICINKFSNK